MAVAAAAISVLTKNDGFPYPFDIPDCPSPAKPELRRASCFGGAVAKRGRPRKKNAQRKPCGRLRELKDTGSEMALAHRADMVGTARAADACAGYPLGILLLRGEIDRAEHDAGVRYAALRAIVYGSSTPRSHLAQWQTILGGNSLFFDSGRDDQGAKARRELREAVAYLLLDGPHPLDALTNAAVLEHADSCAPKRPGHPNELAMLRKALGRLVKLWRIPR